MYSHCAGKAKGWTAGITSRESNVDDFKLVIEVGSETPWDEGMAVKRRARR